MTTDDHDDTVVVHRDPASTLEDTDTVGASGRRGRAPVAPRVEPPVGRDARPPEPEQRVYGPRDVPPPVVASRTPPPARAPQQAVDTARDEALRRRRARIRVTVAVVAASLVVLAAGVTVAALLWLT